MQSLCFHCCGDFQSFLTHHMHRFTGRPAKL
uniref:Uncharacterized protein n=1 Tax=Anguilla anguilla TaxID=7936 RepID=A0A0E9RUE6_ANGAN